MQFDDALLLQEQPTPATPAAGFLKIYAKSDGHLYRLDPSGAEVDLGGGGGSTGLLTREQVPSTLPAAGTVQMFASPNNFTAMPRAMDELGLDAMVDFKRIHGPELTQWNGAIAGRVDRPANIYILGDSISEGGGATTTDRIWCDILRDGLQRYYRPGGVGWISAALGNFAGFEYTPAWTLGAGMSTTDLGFGWGRKGVWGSALTATATITVYCDRAFLVFYTGPTLGTAKITIDGTVAGTFAAATAFPYGGRIWDSGPLTLGYHTFLVAPNAAGQFVLLEGGFFGATDATGGVHVFNGGHGGARTWSFNGDTGEDGTAVGARRNYAALMFQPYAFFTSDAAAVTSDGANPSTLTVTGTSPAFTADDVGECVFGDMSVNTVGRGARIVTVNSATSVTIDRQITAGTYTMSFTRARVTDAGRTINNKTMTSATAAFNNWDTGKTISGTGLLPGTTIRRVVNATTIEVYPWPSSTGTGGTLQIKNRQLFDFRPHLLILYLGANDISYGTRDVDFEANMEAIVKNCTDMGFLDIPATDAFGNAITDGKTGIYNDERPSVMLVSSWSTQIAGDINMVLSTVSGNNHVSANTTGTVLLDPRFQPGDIGKTFSGAPLNGLTITAVDSNGQGATLSGNATATNTGAAVILLARSIQKYHWDAFRRDAFVLAVKNDWMHLDLSNLSGFNATPDPLRILSYDNIHPNDRGHQWVADHVAKEVGGIPRMSAIPQGIFDNPGEMVKGEAQDKAKKVPGVKNKLTADTANTTITPVAITEWAFNIGPNETLTFQFYCIFVGAAATTGMTFRLNGSAGMSTPADLVMAGVAPGSASTLTYVGNMTPTAWPQTALTCTGSGGASIPTVFQVYGSITAGAVGGVITPEFASEVAASQCLLQRGSFAVIL